MALARHRGLGLHLSGHLRARLVQHVAVRVRPPALLQEEVSQAAHAPADAAQDLGLGPRHLRVDDSAARSGEANGGATAVERRRRSGGTTCLTVVV